MKRFWKLATTTVVAIAGLSTMGCASPERVERVRSRSEERSDRFRNAVDPSWPERYNHTTRLETLAPFQVQAQNGSYLDLTVWNYHFEPATDKLTPAGLERLDYFSRKRGTTDTTVYLQTARDVGYDPNATEKTMETRRDLDAKRSASIQKYLALQTAGRGVNYEVQVHDPADPAIPAKFASNAVNGLSGQFSGSISGGGSGGGGGGSSGGGGGGGGGSGGGGASASSSGGGGGGQSSGGGKR
jgi:hypothetical protein